MPDTTNPLLEIFIFETSQLLESLEELMLSSEKSNSLSSESINEIFRTMHTIKGSAAMMMYDSISTLAHAVEDMFYFIRENRKVTVAYTDVCDIVLHASDFIKNEIAKILNDMQPDGNPDELAARIHAYLKELKEGSDAPVAQAQPPKPKKEPTPAVEKTVSVQPLEPGIVRYCAHVVFDENCQMENIRAFGLIHNLKDLCIELSYQPEELLDDDGVAEMIAQKGFDLNFTSRENQDALDHIFYQTMFVKNYTLETSGDISQAAASMPEFSAQVVAAGTALSELEVQAFAAPDLAALEVAHLDETVKGESQEKRDILLKSVKQSTISVNIAKLDSLMDLVGEIVINEAMVTHSPDLSGLQLDNFSKAARQLRKLTDELQDLVMSVRMIPVANTFHKMTRIVRDMSKKLEREADLAILGEDTEVDKNIIDNLSDPLMHLIRNAMDHGIEPAEERIAAGKPVAGNIRLEAVNTGGDVLITIVDDGRGLDRDKILRKARERNLLPKAESDMTDRDIYALILLPGFSTNDEITEFSGRGVGMDVVKQNIDKVGGSVSIDSVAGCGTTVTIKIPLTLAIVDGMMFSVGDTVFTVPTISIKEALRPAGHTIAKDPDGHEIIMLRGQALPIIRLHEAYSIETAVTELMQGIMLVLENETRAVCLFADKLIGEQQVVVKPLPYYLMRYGIKARAGIGGCTILGDGSISLILDTTEIMRCML